MKNTRRALGLGLRVILVMLAVAVAAAACKHKPDNRLIIVKAVWGDMLDEHTMDVTAKVAAMVKDNALKVTADPATLGDPASFKVKKLVVQWSKDGVSAKRRAAEGETIVIRADEIPPKPRLLIQKAVYGELSSGKTIDVTAMLTDLVVNNTLSVKPGSGVFGDPAAMQYKQLRVDYKFDGVAKSKTGGEDQPLTLP
jgi:hypothetical protein